MSGVATHPAVAECAVIARDDELKGPFKVQVPIGLVVLKSGMTLTEADLQQQLISRIRANQGCKRHFNISVCTFRYPIQIV
jgi:propionyl-CoA synthetase